jgi:hypothetical protein
MTTIYLVMMNKTKESAVPVVANNDAPAGFTSFTRGSFRSVSAAQRAASKRVRSGVAGVLIVHDPASRMNDECWVVGRVTL